MKNKYLKLGMMAAVMLSASIGFAQTTVTTDTGLNKGAGDGTSVRVIDNKGTIKYLQTNNGITSITSTAANNTTTTTWQLGGELTSATNIATGANEFRITLDNIAGNTNGTPSGKGTFILDGVELETGPASTDATDGSSGTGTGYTFLVRDEATGKTKKLLASDLITGGQDIIAITTDGQTVVATTGLAAGIAIYKVSVYRNGNKLRGVTDYGVSNVNEITLVPNSVAPNDWSTFVGDVIEVQWVN